MGTVSCHHLILLSCKGEKSLKRDGQHNKGTRVTLALKAFSNRMTYTPLSYKNTHQRTLTHTCGRPRGIESERKAFLLNVAEAVLQRSTGTEGLNTDGLQDIRGSDKAKERAQGPKANEERSQYQRREKHGTHTAPGGQ